MKPQRKKQGRLLRMIAPLVLGCTLVLADASAQELKFYRYKNTSGITVISTKIPPAFVKDGYDIVTRDGRLIERIPPEPTEEEKQRILAEQAEAERQRKRDRELLSRYSSVGDIEADRTRKLAQFDADLRARERSIEKVDEEITLWQSKAADEERRGQTVSAATLDKLSRLRDQKEVILATIKEKQAERQASLIRYEEDIERFRTIRPQ